MVSLKLLTTSWVNMAKLSYWYAECLDDAECYSVVAKTKKEAKAMIAERGFHRYGELVRKEFVYKNAFDLFEYATSEGGGRCMGTTV